VGRVEVILTNHSGVVKERQQHNWSGHLLRNAYNAKSRGRGRPMFQGIRFTRRRFAALGLSWGLFGRAAADGRGVPPAFDVLLENNHRVAMRDGVRLATDVYRPARNVPSQPLARGHGIRRKPWISPCVSV
jgi:predicted acyl esterase